MRVATPLSQIPGLGRSTSPMAGLQPPVLLLGKLFLATIYQTPISVMALRKLAIYPALASPVRSVARSQGLMILLARFRGPTSRSIPAALSMFRSQRLRLQLEVMRIRVRAETVQ